MEGDSLSPGCWQSPKPTNVAQLEGMFHRVVSNRSLLRPMGMFEGRRSRSALVRLESGARQLLLLCVLYRVSPRMPHLSMLRRPSQKKCETRRFNRGCFATIGALFSMRVGFCTVTCTVLHRGIQIENCWAVHVSTNEAWESAAAAQVRLMNAFLHGK